MKKSEEEERETAKALRCVSNSLAAPRSDCRTERESRRRRGSGTGPLRDFGDEALERCCVAGYRQNRESAYQERPKRQRQN